MKSLKSKVILSAVVLIFALVATIGSTFAWFTVSATVTASSITLNVTTQESLLIKVANETVAYGTTPTADEYNALTYKTAVTASDFTSGLGWALNDYVVQPSTIINTDYTAIVPNSYNTIDVSDPTRPLSSITDPFNATDGYAIQLKFWVMTQSETAELRFTSPVITANTGNTTVNGQVANSMRFNVSTNADQVGKIYSNGNLNITDYGYDFNNTINEAPTPVTTDATPGTNQFDALTQLSTWTTLNGTMAAFSGSDATIVDTNSVSGTNMISNTPVLVFVTIYMEGWDADTVNAVIGQQFTISFNFTIL